MIMRERKKERNYTTVAIPDVLMEKITMAVDSGEYGYQNRVDLILDSIRRRLRELGYLK